MFNKSDSGETRAIQTPATQSPAYPNDLIKGEAERLGKKPAEIATACNCSVATVYDTFNGKNVTSQYLRAICDYLGIEWKFVKRAT